mmetsp:Transcript_28463/g.81996  ORF Transcript_28463/g.81996 Transcript_28463/m.81996 type:complete len:371 (-) Transcript_28463:498-1610(-)
MDGQRPHPGHAHRAAAPPAQRRQRRQRPVRPSLRRHPLLPSAHRRRAAAQGRHGPLVRFWPGQHGDTHHSPRLPVGVCGHVQVHGVLGQAGSQAAEGLAVPLRDSRRQTETHSSQDIAPLLARCDDGDPPQSLGQGECPAPDASVCHRPRQVVTHAHRRRAAVARADHQEARHRRLQRTAAPQTRQQSACRLAQWRAGHHGLLCGCGRRARLDLRPALRAQRLHYAQLHGKGEGRGLRTAPAAAGINDNQQCAGCCSSGGSVVRQGGHRQGHGQPRRNQITPCECHTRPKCEFGGHRSAVSEQRVPRRTVGVALRPCGRGGQDDGRHTPHQADQGVHLPHRRAGRRHGRHTPLRPRGRGGGIGRECFNDA